MFQNNNTIPSMKPIFTIVVTLSLMFLSSCDFVKQYIDQTPSLDEAEEQFIKEAQIMSEQDALSKEISYYQAPRITERKFTRKLTGKDIIHEMNILLKENEAAEPDGIFGWTFKWNTEWIAKAKDYAVQHPDDIIAAEYYFTGTFTNYSVESKYSTIRKRLIYIFPPVDQWWDFYVSSN
jgi:hypothetical protein